MPDRYFLQLAYNGRNYQGWQRQENKNVKTIQAEIEAAMQRVLQEPLYLYGCGRTDTGVHASDFYAHFDIETEFTKWKLLNSLNSMLSNDIWIKDIFKEGNLEKRPHARFSASKRTYTYRLCQTRNPFEFELAWSYRQKLDLDLMNKAAQLLLEFRDFEAFSKRNHNLNNYLCRVFEAYWTRETDEILNFRITANRFVRGMVRIVSGALVMIGSGRMSIDEMTEILSKKERGKVRPVAPAQGLYLSKIEYPENCMQRIEDD